MAQRDKESGEARPKPEPKHGEDIADFWREVEKEDPPEEREVSD